MIELGYVALGLRPPRHRDASMKIFLDASKCEAHGDCVLAAPELFDLGDDDEVARLLDATPPESLRAKAESAVKLCPVSAIRVEG